MLLALFERGFCIILTTTNSRMLLCFSWNINSTTLSYFFSSTTVHYLYYPAIGIGYYGTLCQVQRVRRSVQRTSKLFSGAVCQPLPLSVTKNRIIIVLCFWKWKIYRKWKWKWNQLIFMESSCTAGTTVVRNSIILRYPNSVILVF